MRSPGEYADDHVPGALSCPVLDDDERARVGTIYKQVSAFEAKKVGAALVARNIARHLEEQFATRPRGWRPLVYCWRGGTRSGSLVDVFTRIGWRATQLEGGYKAYRRAVIADLALLPERLALHAVCGRTGTGKSRVLRALAVLGHQVLDLEELARHKGSVLGAIPGEPQPSQRMFESLLRLALDSFDASRPVFVESESRKIGALQVPDALIARMRASPCVVIEAAVDTRVALLREEYGHFWSAPQTLCPKLDSLAALHGKGTIDRWKSMASPVEAGELVAELLEHHYDPAYMKSTPNNYRQFRDAPRVVMQGIDADAIRALAQEVATIAAGIPS